MSDSEMDVAIHQYYQVYEDIIVYARQHGIEPILLACPDYPTHRTILTPEMAEIRRKNIQTLIGKHKVRFLDYLTLPLPKECFRDLNHLNERGRQVFTPIVRAAIEQGSSNE